MDFHRILIAVDNGPDAERIALSGLQLAKQFDAQLAMVSIEDTTLYENDELTLKERDPLIERSRSRAQQLIIDKVFKDFALETFVERGRPAEVIVRLSEAWKADIIVLGTHGRKGLSHLIMGSVAEEVMRHSKKMLVIIPIAAL